jgi:hypothetical protein
LVGGRDADFIDEELRRFVRVDVVDSGCEADDPTVRQRSGNVVSWIVARARAS